MKASSLSPSAHTVISFARLDRKPPPIGKSDG
jgi:hypothetical protein